MPPSILTLDDGESEQPPTSIMQCGRENYVTGAAVIKTDQFSELYSETFINTASQYNYSAGSSDADRSKTLDFESERSNLVRDPRTFYQNHRPCTVSTLTLFYLTGQ
ncbi:hypothetical protein J6590_068842 [Homalodisca vitripennis]|nr:hypothetical protein J6590_068842 [Homalodisca vitripennis]